jgi:DNA-directed RNA polymerase subunit E'/Rpb7
MEATQKKQSNFKRRDLRISTIYSRSLITRNVSLPITAVGKNNRGTIEDIISSKFEGKCLVEGYIKPGSSKIITHSSGIVERGTFVLFEVVFECDICFPVEGTLISCVAKNITKAGIRAESTESVPSPVVVFIARDHHYNSAQFAAVKPEDRFNVRVIGQRFELNDKYVSVIGELVKPKVDYENKGFKPKLVIEQEA